jgi:nucleoside-diphosphate-sugar epimerase
MRVLYTGGTGTISHSCVLASVARGDDVFVLNRGKAAARPLPDAVTVLAADLRNPAATREVLEDHEFDAVVDFLCFTAEQAATATALFRGRTRQYVLISSASIYHKPVLRVPFTESTPRRNPFNQYSRDKIAAEDAVLSGFPEAATVVRPSHTYDDRHPPLAGDWTTVDRILRGAEVVVPGDGTSLWTLTHASDFALGLVGLLGNPLTIGETFHITADDVYTWDQVHGAIAAAAGVPLRVVHVPSELIGLAAPEWGWTAGILGDLRYSALFDNSKIRRYVPSYTPRVTFTETVPRLLRWRAEHPELTRPDPAVDAVFERLVSGYHRAEKVFSELRP